MATTESKRNKNLEVFRVKTALLMDQWAEKMRLFVVENVAAGLTEAAIARMRRDPKSRWTMEREALNKLIKREVAGLLNRIHIQAYTREIT